MLLYFLAFGAGYWFGTGGKLPSPPQITQGPNGSIVITPTANPTTAPVGAPATQQGAGLSYTWNLPAGYSVDQAGNVYDGRGILVAAAGSAAQQAFLLVR